MIELKSFEIKSLHYEITGECNLSCAYCYNSKYNSTKKIAGELATKDIKKLIKEAKALGCKSYTFSGGEPFMRKDIFEIIEYCKGNKVAFLTNAKVLTNEFIDKLSAYPQVKAIKITLDGFKNHDQIRVGSDHKQIINAIRYLKKKKFSVVINTEVTASNLGEIERLYKLLKDLKIDRWRVDLPFLTGRYEKNYSSFRLPDFKEFFIVFKRILKDYIAKKPSFELELFNVYKSEITPTNLVTFNMDIHPCSYRAGSVPMRPNGDLVFCPSLELPMANYLKNKNLRSALKEKYQHKFYNLKISDIKECVKCRYLKLCGGGCRADSFYYLKDIAKPDPLACNIMPYFEKEILPILPPKHQAFFASLIDDKSHFPKIYDMDKLVRNVLK